MLHRRKEEALRLVAGSLLTHYSVTSGTRGVPSGVLRGVRVPPSHQQSDKASAEHMVRRRRHPARVSATLLPKDSSLYDAMRAIIGSELRSKLEVPKAMPSYLDDLLKELDDRLGSDQPGGSTHSKRPANC